jgi:hypothetical protein
MNADGPQVTLRGKEDGIAVERRIGIVATVQIGSICGEE